MNKILSVKSLLFVVLSSLSLSWSFVTPFAGVPDEAAYSVYANVVASGQGYGDAKVPVYISNVGALTCFAFQPNQSATCQKDSGWQDLDEELVDVGRSGMISAYPYPYFWVVGQPSRVLSGFEAVYAMRLFALALSISMIGLAILNWPRSHPKSMVIGFLGVFTPLVASMAGVVNPNGFEIIAGFSLGGLLASIILKKNDKKLEVSHLVSILIVSLALSVAKPWSFLFTIVIFGGFLGFTLLPNFRFAKVKSTFPSKIVSIRDQIWLAAILILSVTAGWISNSSYREVMEEVGTKDKIGPVTFYFKLVLGNFTGYAQELIGILGWRDHAAPAFVLVLWLGAIVFALIFTFLNLDVTRKLFLILYVAVVFLALPVYSSRALGLLGGAGYQSRYAGALFTGLVFLCIAYLHSMGLKLESLIASKFLKAIIFSFVFAHVATLTWSFHRYSVGFPLVDKEFPFTYTWVPDYWIVALSGIAVFLFSSTVLIRKNFEFQKLSSNLER